MTLSGVEIGGRLEQPSSQCHGLLVRSAGIFDVEVEVHLLRGAVGPIGGNMLRRQLNPDPPLAAGVDDAMPSVFLENPPTKDPGPERALRVQVRCVEHDHLAHHFHATILVRRRPGP